MKIAIVNTGSGNILSLKRAIEFFHNDVSVTDDSNKILSSNKIFFPGVGAFKKVMNNLKEKKLINTMIKISEKDIPLFGICLGLQLFFDESEEFGLTEGLGLIDGKVKKLPSESSENKKVKVPSIGWYNLNYQLKEENSHLFSKNMTFNSPFYFVHSYYVMPKNKNEIVATYNFGGHEIPAIVCKNNIIGCQFHPEKSSKQGLNLISKFINSK